MWAENGVKLADRSRLLHFPLLFTAIFPTQFCRKPSQLSPTGAVENKDVGGKKAQQQKSITAGYMFKLWTTKSKWEIKTQCQHTNCTENSGRKKRNQAS